MIFEFRYNRKTYYFDTLTAARAMAYQIIDPENPKIKIYTGNLFVGTVILYPGLYTPYHSAVVWKEKWATKEHQLRRNGTCREVYRKK